MEIPADGTITTEARDHLLLIGLQRPAKRNGFTPRMLRELAEAYTRLEEEAGLRVGVLFGHGAHFTGGLDLPAVAPLMARGERLTPEGLVDPLDLPIAGNRRRSKPVVAAVQGITFTIGIELMLAADVAVAADDCRFSQLEARRGVIASGGATLRMAQRAGAGNALLHLLTADEFGSAEALRLNFVQKVVAAGQQLAAAIAIAEAIAAQAPQAVVALRANTLKALEQGPAAAAAEFEATQRRLLATEDAAEGVRSFAEKRPPRFSGR